MEEYQITWKLHSHEAFLLFGLMGMNRVLGYTNPFQLVSPEIREQSLLEAREQLLRDEILVLNDEKLLIEPSLFSVLQACKLSERVCWLHVKKNVNVVDSYFYLSARQVIEFTEYEDYLEITFLGDHNDFHHELEARIESNETSTTNETVDDAIQIVTLEYLSKNYQDKTHRELYTYLLDEEELAPHLGAELVNDFKTNSGIGKLVFLTKGIDDWESKSFRFVLTNEHNLVFIESEDLLKIQKVNTNTFYAMLLEFEKSLLARPEGILMENSHENLLPIGTVVILKEGVKKLMIYGRKQLLLHDESPTMYDYVACYYPEGHINQDYTFVFNHEDIQEVIFKGYKNEEEDRFSQLLNSN